jgi:hypothetical protein
MFNSHNLTTLRFFLDILKRYSKNYTIFILNLVIINTIQSLI